MLASKAAKVWKYDLLATGRSPGDLVILNSRAFEASNLAAAKSFLASVVTDIKPRSSVTANAIRLIDPDGEEIWRGLLAGPRPVVGRPVHEIRSHHPWPLARWKNRPR